jgi:hypothetical protein
VLDHVVLDAVLVEISADDVDRSSHLASSAE